jgi:hypothetical protein
MKHLNSSPPRKYTFDEWAWYLKLIGEDENSADTHRAALRKPRPDGEGLGAALADQNKEVKWSKFPSGLTRSILDVLLGPEQWRLTSYRLGRKQKSLDGQQGRGRVGP